MGTGLGRPENDNEEDERVPPLQAEWLPVRCSSGVCIQYISVGEYTSGKDLYFRETIQNELYLRILLDVVIVSISVSTCLFLQPGDDFI